MENTARQTLVIKNGQSVALNTIPLLRYSQFCETVLDLLKAEYRHCVNYYALPWNKTLKFICCIADDLEHNLHVISHELGLSDSRKLESLTPHHYALHVFEREIWENFGVEFSGHPWLKPLRYAQNRDNPDQKINDYPFYHIESQQLHEVGVGPIHAGIIEPGHFRFICNGETVLHLEIQLGWQHRGVEKIFLEKKSLLQRSILSESIAGDTTVGHTLTFVQLVEALAGLKVNNRLRIERTVALELERIAMYTFDLSNLCVGTAYQLGANVFGALRTPLINYFQSWCGNRFGRNLIRAGGTHYPLTPELRATLETSLKDYLWRFREMADNACHLPSLQNRFDGIGAVTRKQMYLIGAVGLTARMTGLQRDIRHSHPTAYYSELDFSPVLTENGDAFARFLQRREEIMKSLRLFQTILNDNKFELESQKPQAENKLKFQPNAFAISLSEGWRGEICHCAVTDDSGDLVHYKVKDPSLHNWMALALSLRNLEISDFPINNKSYNLSYCGHDL